jgi:hypothetical protein
MHYIWALFKYTHLEYNGKLLFEIKPVVYFSTKIKQLYLSRFASSLQLNMEITQPTQNTVIC